MKTYVHARDWNRAAYERARKEAGLTYLALHKRLGRNAPSPTTVATWGRGACPRRELVPRIARALRVPVKALLQPAE
jgi:transcriptional regulator with XRE-family HTH domain